MTKIYAALMLLMTALLCMPSQAFGRDNDKERDRDKDKERSQWNTEMRQYKRQYFTRELKLSREQQNKFFPIYEEMEDATAKVEDDTRAMERLVSEAKEPTELEYQKATEAIYEAPLKIAEIEQSYLPKLQEVLKPKQMFRLKAVERQFARDMIRQHHRLRAKAKS